MKRLFALTLALAMMFSLFAGCSKEEPTATTAAPAGDNKTDTTTAAPVESGNKRTDIVIGVTSDVVSPDPHNQNDTSSGKVLHMMFDTLLYMNGDGEYEPCLAESWENTSDTEYVFHLRKGVKFHNGVEMTAKDVKFTVERCMESAKTAQATDSLTTLKLSTITQ